MITSFDAVADAVDAARRGDPVALERLVAGTLTDVWRFLAHLVDAQSADDLTQETYLRAWQSLGRFRGDASLRTWLLAVARHVAADELRARRRRSRETLSGDPAGERGSGPDVRSRDGRAADIAEEVGVRDLISRLVPDRREAFVLTQVIGLEYAEAARTCGCPVGTIRSRVARARDDLARMVREDATERTPAGRSGSVGAGRIGAGQVATGGVPLAPGTATA